VDGLIFYSPPLGFPRDTDGGRSKQLFISVLDIDEPAAIELTVA
jgi:hypothetical protein